MIPQIEVSVLTFQKVASHKPLLVKFTRSRTHRDEYSFGNSVQNFLWRYHVSNKVRKRGELGGVGKSYMETIQVATFFRVSSTSIKIFQLPSQRERPEKNESERRNCVAIYLVARSLLYANLKTSGCSRLSTALSSCLQLLVPVYDPHCSRMAS